VPYAYNQVVRVVTLNFLLNSCFWRSYHLIKLRVASPNFKFKSFCLRSFLCTVFYTILLLWQIIGIIYKAECAHRFSSPSKTNFDLFGIHKPYCPHTMAQSKIIIGELWMKRGIFELHVTKAYWSSELYFHLFFISALDRGKLQFHARLINIRGKPPPHPLPFE